MFHLTITDGQLKIKSRWQKHILLLILTLLMVVSSGCFRLVSKAPHEQMITAAKKTSKLKEMSIKTGMSFQIKSENQELAMFNQIFNNLSIAFGIGVDKNEIRSQLDFNILYKGVNCGDLLLYMDREKIAVQSVFLGDKTLFYTWKDLETLIQKYFSIQVQIPDYFPLLFETKRRTRRQVETAIYDLYADFYADHLTATLEPVDITINEDQQKKTIACKELVLQMDHEDLNIETSYRYLQALLENEAVLSLFKEKITQGLAIAKKNGDLATWPLTEEEILAFRDNLDLFLTQLASQVFTQQQANQAILSSPPQMDMLGKFRIDRQGYLRNMVINEVMQLSPPEETGEPILFELFMEANLESPKQELTFLDLNRGQLVDISKLSATDWQVLGEELAMNFMVQAMVNPLFQDILQMSAVLDSEEY